MWKAIDPEIACAVTELKALNEECRALLRTSCSDRLQRLKVYRRCAELTMHAQAVAARLRALRRTRQGVRALNTRLQ
jgi:hypothetical protein